MKRAALGLLLAALASCSNKTVDKGGLMLIVSSDGALPIDRIHIRVQTTGDNPTVLRNGDVRIPGETTLPTTLGIVSNGNPAATVAITVSAFNGTSAVDTRDALVYEIPVDRVAALPVVLSARCSAQVNPDGSSKCGAGKTCDPVTGGCVSANVDATSQLTTYSPGAEDEVGAPDAVTMDSSVDDTGSMPDTTMPDTTIPDTTVTDTGTVDTAPDDTGTPDTGTPDTAPIDTGSPDMGVETKTPVCADGIADFGEACDDGNKAGADGCTPDCKAVERGFSCPPAGVCLSTVKCGDGKVEGLETCDDTNAMTLDGCDASCHVETGWRCDGVPSKCTRIPICGNGKMDPGEECDDANSTNGDGCALCKLEPGYVCAGTMCHALVCGDTKTEGPETCDDANTDPFDGCTNTCARSPACIGGCAALCGDGIKAPTEACDDGNILNGDGCSSTCTKESGWNCAAAVPPLPASISIPIVIRDFSKTHADMEKYIGAQTGIVKTALAADGKPAYAPAGASATVTSKTSFDQWYHDVGGVNQRFVKQLTLIKQADNSYQYDSGTGYFPIDGVGYGSEGFPHNFNFTTELRYPFVYAGGETLTFTGDDDVFVFINSTLVIDMGGVHAATTASVTLDASKAATLGLTVGSVYQIAIFHAERHTSESNYKLTMKGFGAPRSTCVPNCGDGLVVGGEVCDDTKNDGTYGGCTPSCGSFAPHCGDGVKQAPEDCDDGTNISTYGGCAPGCKYAPRCGDAKVDGLSGETCDPGVVPTATCSAACKLL